MQVKIPVPWGIWDNKPIKFNSKEKPSKVTTQTAGLVFHMLSAASRVTLATQKDGPLLVINGVELYMLHTYIYITW